MMLLMTVQILLIYCCEVLLHIPILTIKSCVPCHCLVSFEICSLSRMTDKCLTFPFSRGVQESVLHKCELSCLVWYRWFSFVRNCTSNFKLHTQRHSTEKVGHCSTQTATLSYFKTSNDKYPGKIFRFVLQVFKILVHCFSRSTHFSHESTLRSFTHTLQH
jgi:hypothetical protein